MGREGRVKHVLKLCNKIKKSQIFHFLKNVKIDGKPAAVLTILTTSRVTHVWLGTKKMKHLNLFHFFRLSKVMVNLDSF